MSTNGRWRSGAAPSVFERHHFLVFLSLVAVGLGVMTLGVRNPAATEAMSRSGLRAVEPLARTGSAVAGAGKDLWTGLRDAWAARRELEAAREELRDTRLLLSDREELAAENERFRRLLDLSARVQPRGIPALIVYRERAPECVFVVDQGSRDGVRKDMAVIAPDGVVGKVLAVTDHSAKVQCVIDADAGVAVLVGAGRRQADAIVADGSGGLARLRHLDLLQDLAVGDRVVTSGLDQIYPRGLLVGTIEEVEGQDSPHPEVLVRPAVDFSRLEDVLILASPAATDEAPPAEKPARPAAPAARKSTAAGAAALEVVRRAP